MSRQNCLLSSVAAALLMSVLATPSRAQEAQWIWSPEHGGDAVPRSSCHFRKVITVRNPQRGHVSIIADDTYEVHVNGRRIAAGESTEKLQEHDITRFLARGRNLIAVKVSNTRGSTGGLAARVMVQERGSEWESHSTDGTWKTSLRPWPFWNTMLYNDKRWLDAHEMGQLGETAPWDVREAVTESEGDPSTERFKLPDEFEILQVVDGQVGSLIAMAFNEFGHILASREGGPLLLIYDSDDDGLHDRFRPYCDQVKNCQGILPLNGDVFVTGDGPDGVALYRLSDVNCDGMLEEVTPLVKFNGDLGEHGVHGLTLGPDGKIYIIVGNHGSPQVEFAESSPYRNHYEGELVTRYEDPGGHAAGIKAPGGTVIRTDLEGKKVELVAGGLRNAYDLAFNRAGELFVHDGDMESDIGTAWYRPTRLYHVTAGGEFGWRSGWSKWPDYFTDVLPGVLDTGRGSPTGAVFYTHHAFPTNYHDKLFLADWSEGRILAVDLTVDGASYAAKSEVFLEGRPLNVTDLEVSPDGAIYFVTGGRGTEGGIYRVAWKGDIPEEVQDLGEGMTSVIRQPQLASASTRQKLAGLQQSLGDDWDGQLRGVARSTSNPWYYRVRALHLMQLFGPAPTETLLLKLSEDGNEAVRGEAAQLLGVYGGEQGHERLRELLDDSDRMVRRMACEALLNADQTAPFEPLAEILTSDDRFESWAARRLLEQIPVEQWRASVLAAKDHRLFIQGGLALMIAHPSEENALAISSRFAELMNDFISDRDFIDMLRLVQVTMERSSLTAQDVPELAASLAEEFPSSDATMNRELVRLLVHLQVASPMDRYLAFLESDADDLEKLHLAMQLRFLQTGWQEGQRVRVLDFYDKAKRREGGGSYQQYLAQIERDFAKSLTDAEAADVLALGHDRPSAAIGVLYGLPHDLDSKQIRRLKVLDGRLRGNVTEAAQQLRVGIIAVLARSGAEDALEYLYSVWDEEPERRESLAMGLAQHPGGHNWEYLLKGLAVIDGAPAQEVVTQLRSVDSVPEDPEHFRQVILFGLKSKQDTPAVQAALELLRHWHGEPLVDEDIPAEEALGAWQEWYAKEHPDRPTAELPVASPEAKWKFSELYVHLSSETGSRGSSVRGAVVFEKAKCAQCHRYGARGESIGPDLTSISKRFMKKEVLESIVYPSHVISDQYASKTVVTTNGRVYSGIVASGLGGEKIVLQSNGQKVPLAADRIDQIVPNNESAMPAGLLDTLTLEDISDLLTYLGVLPSQSVVERRRVNASR